jgi:hypothetical protein
MQSAVAQVQEVHARVWGVVRMKSIVGYHLSPKDRNYGWGPCHNHATYLQKIACIFHTFPVPVGEHKRGPRDFLHDSTIMMNGGDRPIKSIGGFQKMIDWLSE